MARRLTKLRVDEISLVDRPANPGARVVLAKRAAPEEDEMDADIDAVWQDTLTKVAEITAGVARLERADRAEKMTKRIAAIRKADPRISSDERAILKIAESNDPADRDLWKAHRAEMDKAPDAGSHKAPVVTLNPIDGLGPSTEPPIDPTKTRPAPNTPQLGRAPSKATAPYADAFDALVDQHQTANPGKHRGHSVIAVMNTPEGKAAYRHMRSEHLIGMTKSYAGPMQHDAPQPPRPPSSLGTGRTPHGDALEAHIDAHMRDHPGISRDQARAKVVATDKGGTLLLRHERALRDTPDHVTS